jgi:uncharacterized protein YidB (DUF937 family)
MTALLGLLAVAGYQNRDRLGQLLNQGQGGGMGGLGRTGGGQMNQHMGGLGGGQMGGMGGQMGGLPGGLGGLLGGLMGGGGMGGGATGGGLGGLLGGGLGELDQRMRQNGHGQTMDSWVGTGQNRQVEPHDLEAALGPDVLDDLTETTGLSRQEILQRLSRELPHAVDQYTPSGRLPQSHEF